MASNSRADAAQLLGRVLSQQGSLGKLLSGDRSLAGSHGSEVREFCYGVMRWYFQLDGLLQKLLSKPLRRKDIDVRALLLIGLYQQQHMRLPDHAAVAETVAAVKPLGKPWAKGLVNGVLRNYQREAEQLLGQLDEAQSLGFPAWLLESLQHAWPQDWQNIVKASNQRPPMTLRVNMQHGARDNYLRRLADAGVDASPGQVTEQSITLKQASDVMALPDFAVGAASVQDEAAQLAAGLLQLQAGQTVLDACCAPGGKTCHLLELQPEIKLLAVDQDAQRLQRVTENLQRLKLRADVLQGDASQPQTWPDQHGGKHRYDRILLDVPCSATGVIRRNPDLKYLRRATDIAALNILQADILAACWALLRPGGKLLYVTCSILPEENEQIVAAFVETQPDATHDPIAASWGLERSIGRQLLPSTHDGFYYARLIKNADTNAQA